MYIYEPNEAIQEKLIKIFSTMSYEQDSPNGIVRFIYPEIIDLSGGTITNQSMLSGILNYYRQEGVLERVKRGGPSTPSVWDVSALLEKSHSYVEASAVEVTPYVISTPEEPKEEVVSLENQDSLSEITSTLTSMMDFLQSLPGDLLPTIETFHTKVSKLKNGKDEELEARYEELANDYADKVEDIQGLEKEKRTLQMEVKRLESQLQELKNSKPSFDEHRIYRSRNLILDEIERYFAQPGWARKTKSEHVRMVVSNHLDLIMKELNIAQPAEVNY